MNATGEKYQDEEVKEVCMKWTLNQVAMLQQLQCMMLARKQTSSLSRSIEALKEGVDAALKLFKIHDVNAVDFSDSQDDEGYLSESSSDEADW